MLKKKFILISILLVSSGCINSILPTDDDIKKNPSSSITSSPIPLPTFSIPPNFNIGDEAFLKKEDYIKYLQCALDNSKDEKEKDNLRKSIDTISNVSSEIKFKPNKEYLQYCSHLVPKITTSSNEKILSKEDYIKYLNCAYDKSKIDVQKEAIKRNIETVKNSPDNFKFNANIEFLEECGNL